MNSLPIYLGYKYFRSKKGAFASFTSLMAIAGLALGVAALVIVLSVMNGFEKELQTRVSASGSIAGWHPTHDSQIVWRALPVVRWLR